MITSVQMLSQLYEIHLDTQRSEISHKTVKVVVDSLREQILGHYFDIKPNGLNNDRLLINRKIKNVAQPEDIRVLQALTAVLREYDDVLSKNYNSRKDTLEPFLDNQLKELSRALVNHSSFAGNSTVDQLRHML